MPDPGSLESTLRDLRRAVQDLELRVQRLEAGAAARPGSSRAASATVSGAETPTSRPGDPGALEQRVGERWLGPTGVFVLLAGAASFINYPFGPAIPSLVQIGVGLATAGGFFYLARQWEGDNPFMARVLLAGSLVLLYLSVLRLHFFSADPLVPSRSGGLALLALVPALAFAAARWRRAQVYLVLALILTSATSLIGDGYHATLGLMAAGAAAAVWIARRQRWTASVALALPLAYGGHLLWLFNNPVMGHRLQAVADPQLNILYVFAYWAGLAAWSLLGTRGEAERPAGVVLALANCTGLLALGTLTAWAHYQAHFEAVELAMAAACLGQAAGLWWRRRGGVATAVCACFGYLALTVAIVAHFERQECFLWLAAQSLLVVSTAIWFRSRLIVVANVFIYLGILVAYLVSGPSLLLVNLVFAAVALLSARVMAWKKQRLALRTDALRTTYLAVAFMVIPYGLYHGVPPQYVSLSWVGAAGFYFLLSSILDNQKYRWMAILTMLLTVGYVFLVDLGRLSPALRTVSLLVLGLALTAASLVYARRRHRRDGGEADDR
ncbi:MAG: hypothetical protein ABIL09_27495 [Gemmatimonadota bacterium]